MTTSRGRATYSPIVIRPATANDFGTIAEIYGHHVRGGFSSFEESVPDAAELARRMRAVLDHGLPYLVAEFQDDVRGFAYAAPYRERSAYRYSVENSVYVSPDWPRRGIGGALLEALIERCAALGKRHMIAVIGDSANHASIELHTRLGFSRVGTLPSVGYKLDRWVDSVIMSRALGDGDETPPRS